MMDSDSKRFRRNTLLIFLAYAVPLLGAFASAFALGLRDSEGLPTPVGVLAGLSCCGLVWSAWRIATDRRSGDRQMRGRPVADERRKAILREFPEFAPLSFEGAGGRNFVGVSGRVLLIGANYLAQTGGPAERMGDDLYRALAHEARHLEIGASWQVFAFRFMKGAYLATGLFNYISFLLNWVGLLDGPNRLALMAYLASLPYLLGFLLVVLDETMDAYEWRLELDADRAAAARCHLKGRSFGFRVSVEGRRLAKRFSDRYPPTPLQLIARSGGTPTVLQVWAPLLAGLLVAVVPICLDILFASFVSPRADTYNAALGYVLLILLAISGAILLASSVFVPDARKLMALGEQPTSPRTTQVFALYAVRVFALGWTAMSVAASLFLIICLLTLIPRLRFGVPTVSAILALLMLLSISLWYRNAARDCPSPRGLVFGGAGEFIRLTCQSWFLLALAVFPFYNDLQGLGTALLRNPGLVAPELNRLFAVEAGRMWILAGISACVSIAIVALAWWGRAVGKHIILSGKTTEALV